MNDTCLICVNVNEKEETRGRGMIEWTNVQGKGGKEINIRKFK